MGRMGLDQGGPVGRGGGPGGEGGLGDQARDGHRRFVGWAAVGSGVVWGLEEGDTGQVQVRGMITCVVLLQLDCMCGRCVKAHLLYTHLWTC